MTRPSDLARRLEQIHEEICCLQGDILDMRDGLPFTWRTRGTAASLEKDWNELQRIMDRMSVMEDRMRKLDRDIESGRLEG